MLKSIQTDSASIGLPGDKVAYRDKRLTINGEAITTTTTGRTWDSGTSQASYKIITEQLGRYRTTSSWMIAHRQCA